MQPAEARKTRQIRQISVTNLFGIFNHVLPLNMNEHITIIHGPNGFGKTMILKLLHTLFSQDDSAFRRIPFDEFKVEFADNTSVWVSKPPLLQKLGEEEATLEQEIVFYATGEKEYLLPSRLEIKEGSIPPFPLSMIERYIPSLERITSNSWMIYTNEILSLTDVVERFSDHFPSEFFIEKGKVPEWLTTLRKSVPIHLIETQRLLSPARTSKRNERTSGYAVTEDSRHLIDVIRKKLAESAALSQSLDGTFPARLLSSSTQPLPVTEDQLLDKLEQLEKKRLQLMSVGLLDQERVTIGSRQGIEPNTKAVLAVYAEDTEQKLGIFDDLAQKIGLLTTIINKRFLYKSMTISKEKGFVFTTKKGTILPLENLSSGEQHELVLFYELLFRVPPGSFILVDEPELSLHVVWQEQFLKDVQHIAEITSIDIIFATHSPDIISNRRDLVVELEGPADGEL